MHEKIENNIKVRFAILTKAKVILTKRIYLDENGKPQKDSSECFLSNGMAGIHECDFREFPKLLRSLEKNECIVHGVFDDKKYGDEEGVVGIVTKDIKSNEFPDNNLIISRTKEYFTYPSTNALTMFDYDVDEGDTNVLSVDEYIEAMSSILPGFKKCAKVVTPSTSSCLYDKNNTPLSGKKPSFHMYFVVKNSNDLKRFKEVLFKRCWLMGYGKIKIDEAKRIQLRAIFDKSVFSSERPDFVAGAFCEEGIIQILPDPQYYDGCVLDTSLLPDLTNDEEIEYARILYETKKPYLKEYEKFKEERISKVVIEKGWSQKHAEGYIKDLDNFLLWNSFFLTLDDNTKITVKDLLENGEKYDGASMYDPFEPEAGNAKAKFFWNDGKNSIIHSFIHGERNYTFKKQNFTGRSKPVPTDKEPTFGNCDSFYTIEKSREILNKELQKFFGNSPLNQLLIMNAGIGKSRSFMSNLSKALKRSTKGLYGIKVAYFVPDNQLSHELLLEYHDDKSLVGMPCMIRGRGHHNNNLSPPCEWANQYLKSGIETKEYNQKVKEISSQYCRDECRLNNNCQYIKQFKDAMSAHIVFMSNQYLFTMSKEFTSINEELLLNFDDEESGLSDLFPQESSQKPQKSLIKSFTHIVIDEDIISSHILDTNNGEGIFSCDRIESNIVRDIIDDIELGAEMKHVLGVYKKEIEEEYKKHRRIIDQQNNLAAYNLAKYKRTFWRHLKKSCQNLENTNYVNNVWVDGNELKIGNKKGINTLWKRDKKILYIDASADKDIVQTALNIQFHVKEIKTHFHDDVIVKQMGDNLFSSNHLAKNHEKIFTSLKTYFDGTFPPFITSQTMEESILKNIALSQLVTISGHFKHIRGTDTFKNEEKLIIIGRYLLNPKVLKEKFRILYPKTINPLNFEYTYQEFVYRMKSGKNMAVMQQDYAIGSDAWKLNNHLSRSETEQAVARIRPFDAAKGKPKTVYIFTSQVLDVTIGELFSSSDFNLTEPKEPGDHIQNGILYLLEENGGILRWKPKDISEKISVSVDSINNARTTSWFIKNQYWNLVNVAYEKVGNKSRISKVTDTFLVLKDIDFKEELIQKFLPNETLRNITVIDKVIC